MMKHASETFQEWLNWPGDPFEWRQCDSPIEDNLFHEVHKFASDQVALDSQCEIKTQSGTFRIDFVLRHRTTGRPIGIECDGKEFHDLEKDAKRDAAIMATGQLAALYRVYGKDCYYCSNDVLQLISSKEPWAFSDGFFKLASFRPNPITYEDDELSDLQFGYAGIRRSYFEYVERDEEYQCECYCEEECDCRYVPEVVASKQRTPTVIRYLSTQGHASAYEQPAQLIPLPMPKWKVELAQALQEGGCHSVGGSDSEAPAMSSE